MSERPLSELASERLSYPMVLKSVEVFSSEQEQNSLCTDKYRLFGERKYKGTRI